MDLIQEESDQAGTQEIVRYNFPSIPFRLFGAIDPTLEAYIRFADIRIDHRQKNQEHPEGKETIRRL